MALISSAVLLSSGLKISFRILTVGTPILNFKPHLVSKAQMERFPRWNIFRTICHVVHIALGLLDIQKLYLLCLQYLRHRTRVQASLQRQEHSAPAIWIAQFGVLTTGCWILTRTESSACWNSIIISQMPYIPLRNCTICTQEVARPTVHRILN